MAFFQNALRYRCIEYILKFSTINARVSMLSIRGNPYFYLIVRLHLTLHAPISFYGRILFKP